MHERERERERERGGWGNNKRHKILQITFRKLSEMHAATDAHGSKWMSYSFDAVEAKEPILLDVEAMVCTT